MMTGGEGVAERFVVRETGERDMKGWMCKGCGDRTSDRESKEQR